MGRPCLRAAMVAWRRSASWSKTTIRPGPGNGEGKVIPSPGAPACWLSRHPLPEGEGCNTALISAIAMTGTKRQNSRKQVKNRPKLPASVAISIDVGLYDAQLDGR